MQLLRTCTLRMGLLSMGSAYRRMADAFLIGSPAVNRACAGGVGCTHRHKAHVETQAHNFCQDKMQGLGSSAVSYPHACIEVRPCRYPPLVTAGDHTHRPAQLLWCPRQTWW